MSALFACSTCLTASFSDQGIANGRADKSTLIDLTAEIVAAYVERNSVQRSELPGVISSVYGALLGLGTPPAEPAAEPQKPAVIPKKSVTDESIISLEDGRKLKSMKRYLAVLGMTPADYRMKWGLPADYPAVAPAYAKARSEMALRIGLGQKKAPLSEPPPVPASAKKRGRPKAA